MGQLAQMLSADSQRAEEYRQRILQDMQVAPGILQNALGLFARLHGYRNSLKVAPFDDADRAAFDESVRQLQVSLRRELDKTSGPMRTAMIQFLKAITPQDEPTP